MDGWMVLIYAWCWSLKLLKKMLETMKKWDFEWKKINLFTVFQQWKHNVVSSCTFKIKAQKMLQKWCKSSLLLIPTNFIYWSGKIQPNILHLEALFCNMDNCCSQKVKIHMTLLNTRIVPTKKPQLILKGSADWWNEVQLPSTMARVFVWLTKQVYKSWFAFAA